MALQPDEIIEIIKIIVGTYRHNIQQSREKYYGWIRTCLTVASGSVALLVGLQGSYVPANPRWIWTLQAAWVCFSVTILCASRIDG